MMNEFDVVVLIHDLPERGIEGRILREGARGAIVERYDDGSFLVEFFDENGGTLDLMDVQKEDIRAPSALAIVLPYKLDCRCTAKCRTLVHKII